MIVNVLQVDDLEFVLEVEEVFGNYKYRCICPFCGESDYSPEYKSLSEAVSDGSIELERRARFVTIGKTATVTSFSDYVFRMQHKLCKCDEHEGVSASLMQDGLRMHASIELTIEFVLENSHDSDGWACLYVDGHSGESSVFESDFLFYDSVPIKGRPDLVLWNRLSKSIIVVERKLTSFHSGGIPPAGWLNNRCQVWAYAHMPWEDVDRIYGVVEFWRDSYLEGGPLYNLEKRCLINLYDADVNQECVGWFRKFGGEVREQPSWLRARRDWQVGRQVHDTRHCPRQLVGWRNTSL